MAMNPARALLLTSLTHKVRFLTIDQAERLLGCSRATAYRLAAELADDGLVERHHLFIQRLPEPLAGPLASWEPGQPDVDIDELVSRNRRRWATAGPPTLTQVLIGTARAARATGGSVRPVRVSEGPHDWLMCEVVLSLSEAEWGALVKEDCIKVRRGQRGCRPDAWLVWGKSSQHRVAIEGCGSSYGPGDLRKLTTYLMANSYPFRLY
jgi:hypothetical protein